MERKMATVEVIDSLSPIEGADRIELAKVRGWNVVVQKGLYEVGDPVVYFEIDTMLPQDDKRFESFMTRGVRTDSMGRTGHVVKTIRLKGQYSQGLVMPLQEFSSDLSTTLTGQDVSNDVGVWKWEPPIPASLRGEIRGKLPGWIRRTDAERIQNFEEYLPLNPDEYYCTEKLDGTSVSFSLNDDDFHVCSRNLDLKETEGNTYWEIAHKYRMYDVLIGIQKEWEEAGSKPNVVTIQGEIYGEGVNGNRLALKGRHFAAFHIDLIGDECTSWGDYDPYGSLKSWGMFPVVPLLDITAPQSVSEALEVVDGIKSTIAPSRLAEGVVWRRIDGQDIIPGVRYIKAISNKYLLKEK